MTRSAALYMILVGLPLCGLLAVLHGGESLQPPPHVGGAWSLTESCPAAPAGTAISIDQSGRFLRTRFRDGAASRGRLDGDRLHARVLASVGACAGHELAIEARLGNGGQSFTGSIEAPRCSACPASTFVAEREKASP